MNLDCVSNPDCGSRGSFSPPNFFTIAVDRVSHSSRTPIKTGPADQRPRLTTNASGTITPLERDELKLGLFVSVKNTSESLTPCRIYLEINFLCVGKKF